MNPFFNRIVTGKVQAHFLEPNRAVLEAYDKEAYALALAAESLQSLHSDHVVKAFMGHPNQEAFCEAMSQRPGPEHDAPLLVLAAADDPVCSSKNILYDFFYAAPRAILAVSPKGSHLAFFTGEGGFRVGRSPKEVAMESNWAETATMEFLRHALEVGPP